MSNQDQSNSADQDKMYYNKLTDFIKRLNVGYNEEVSADEVMSPSIRESQIPRLPAPMDTCYLETPDGEKHELPIYEPVLGPKAIDGQFLHKKSGYFTYDPGFTSTASCVSAITFIDGNKGQLLYRGYSIDKLAENCNFLEVCFLLLYGNLPDIEQLRTFEEKVMDEMMVHEKIKEFYKGYQSNAHPMSIMCGVVGALSQFFIKGLDVKDPQQRETTAIKLIAKFPTLAAISFRTSKGLPLV